MTEDWNGRRSGRTGRASVLTMLRTAGIILAVAVALGILYLAFHGSPAHQAAATGGAATGSGTENPAGGGTRAPSIISPATPVGASAAPGAAQAGPLGGAVQSYLAGRSGTVRAAVYDLATGKEWSLGGGGAAQDEASIVKVNILEALLLKRPAGLTSYDQSLARQMIEDSDNDAATTLWNLVGGATGIGSYNSLAGLTQTTPSVCVQCPNFPWPGWGLTTTTPEDQVTLLRRLVQPGGPLTRAQRDYALSLMESVASDQRWGVSGGVPTGVTVALKNGWLPLDAAKSNWQINSVGWVSGGGRDYLLAMLSTGNPSQQYGIATLDAVGAMVWNGLAR